MRMKSKMPTKREAAAELARRDFVDFARFAHSSLCLAPFHLAYYRVLEHFARGDIRKLIVTMPPQHGKSLAASVLLPAYLLGIDPDMRIALASYNQALATKFNRRVQRLMDGRNYRAVFPGSGLKSSSQAHKGYARTSEEFDIVRRSGGMMAVGREGALTGNTVDVMIIDDLYKDAMEANSPVVRDNAWDWYMSVVKTRLHNDSRELLVMTRWSDDDLVGRISKAERVVDIEDPDTVAFEDRKCWYRLNFEAIKDSAPSVVDPRAAGEALWEERHSAESLAARRSLDQVMFSTLYQGCPVVREGLLYGDGFRTYASLPEGVLKKGNYTDTADTGSDYLCSVCYDLDMAGDIYVTDVVYSQLGMEFTEEAVAGMLDRNMTRVAYVESNNGGRGFARNLRKMAGLTKIEWFHQGANKESRILTNSSTVLRRVVMPDDWHIRWPEFYRDVTGYKRVFRNNRYHDAADVLTGIIEYEVVNRVDKTLKAIRFR